MKINIIIISIFLISVLILNGCTTEESQVSEEDIIKEESQLGVQNEEKTEIVCNEPYIRHADDCCLDTNSNNICDVDEEVNNDDNEIVEVIDEEFLEMYCNSESTTLKKETLFNENLKGQYVTWEGTVQTISEYSSGYTMGVKLCDSTWTWDIDVVMRDDQKNILLNINEGDKVTFKAKMKKIGGFLTDLSAEDGQIIS